MTVRTITVEPMTPTLRKLHNLQGDPNRLAVVLAGQLGKVIAILHTTDDVDDAYALAYSHGRRIDTPVLTASAFRPTVVGKDVAATVLADPASQPTETLDQLAALAGMLEPATIRAILEADLDDDRDGLFLTRDALTPTLVTLMIVQRVTGDLFQLNATGERLHTLLAEPSLADATE